MDGDEVNHPQPGSSGPAAPGRASATGLGGRRPGRLLGAAMAAALPRDDPHPSCPPITVHRRSSELLSPACFSGVVAWPWCRVPSLNRLSGRYHGGLQGRHGGHEEKNTEKEVKIGLSGYRRNSAQKRPPRSSRKRPAGAGRARMGPEPSLCGWRPGRPPRVAQAATHKAARALARAGAEGPDGSHRWRGAAFVALPCPSS